MFLAAVLANTMVWVGAALALRRSVAVSEWRFWLMVPALVIVVAVLGLTELPVRAGLATAQPTMQECVSDPAAVAPSRVGIYQVESAEHLPGGGALFVVQGAEFIDGAGFAYSPVGASRVGSDEFYEHVPGSWYGWKPSW